LQRRAKADIDCVRPIFEHPLYREGILRRELAGIVEKDEVLRKSEHRGRRLREEDAIATTIMATTISSTNDDIDASGVLRARLCCRRPDATPLRR